MLYQSEIRETKIATKLMSLPDPYSFITTVLNLPHNDLSPFL